MSMSTVKLEGVGEGMFMELAEDMVMEGTLLLWPMPPLLFCTSFCLGDGSDDTSLLSHQHGLGQLAPRCHPQLSNPSTV